jgi:hypothetical protein
VTGGLRQPGRLASGAAAKGQDVQQRIAHQPVAAMNAAGDFPGAQQAGHVGLAVAVDDHAAVLVVQGGVDQHGFTAGVDAAFVGQVLQGRQALCQFRPQCAGIHAGHCVRCRARRHIRAGWRR